MSRCLFDSGNKIEYQPPTTQLYTMSPYNKKIIEAEDILIQYGFTRTERHYINPRIKPDIIYERKSDNGKVVKLSIHLDVVVCCF